MSYRFEAGETSRESFRRCTHEQLDRAIQELTHGVEVDPVEAVHEARKALKMERALLRLARSSLKPALRRRENAAVRDAAARLSGVRDADVMLEALDGLTERYAGQVPESTFVAIRSRLEAERDRISPDAGTSSVEAAIGELQATRERAANWQLRQDGWKALEGGLRWAYTRGRKAFARARRAPTSENLHEWRKRAKDLWYDLRLLTPSAPLILAGEVDAAHRLSDLLGDDHDLAVLHETVIAIAQNIPDDVAPVLALIDHQRQQLQREAFGCGRRLYAEKPGAFVRRLHTYWKTARREAHAPDQPARLSERVREAAVV